ncbi:hypothetical protein F511_21082 [Dorcoceras hygrometricum]|uniref:Uncharacterized protein n=1 Tax=Dorcoceras hygrometricum TaxID=472368 RepID=A0A2Z7CMK7_9LAMI|nr:hypothetical protein F511_21082 [Dorcoceras hygrometricum]
MAGTGLDVRPPDISRRVRAARFPCVMREAWHTAEPWLGPREPAGPGGGPAGGAPARGGRGREQGPRTVGVEEEGAAVGCDRVSFQPCFDLFLSRGLCSCTIWAEGRADLGRHADLSTAAERRNQNLLVQCGSGTNQAEAGSPLADAQPGTADPSGWLIMTTTKPKQLKREGVKPKRRGRGRGQIPEEYEGQTDGDQRSFPRRGRGRQAEDEVDELAVLAIRIRPPARQRKNIRKRPGDVQYENNNYNNRQSGPRPEPRLLHQAALEALTRSARTDSPRRTGRKQISGEDRRRRVGGGGGVS